MLNLELHSWIGVILRKLYRQYLLKAMDSYHTAKVFGHSSLSFCLLPKCDIQNKRSALFCLKFFFIFESTVGNPQILFTYYLKISLAALPTTFDLLFFFFFFWQRNEGTERMFTKLLSNISIIIRTMGKIIIKYSIRMLSDFLYI